MRRLSARVSWVAPAALVLGLGLRPAAAAPAGDAAHQLIAALAGDKAHAALIAEPLRRAKGALERARAMDAAGDGAHARILRDVAAEWAELARDLGRAGDAEARAVAAERALDELETKRVRDRALLEETVARRGRAREALEQLEREPPTPSPSPRPSKGGKPQAGKATRPAPARAAEPKK